VECEALIKELLPMASIPKGPDLTLGLS